jgi:hypothetical protein
MGTKYFKVTIEADYSVEADNDEDIDEDFLHDAIRDNFDTIDLEFDAEHPMYDEDGDETDDTFTIHVNGDNIRRIDVVSVPE